MVAIVEAEEEGSVLLEALVALAILAGSITAMTDGASTALRRIDGVVTDRHVETVALAMIGRVGSDFPKIPGQRAGQTGDGIKWQLTLAEDMGSRGPGRSQLLSVEVQAWREGKQGRPIVFRSLARTDR